MKISPIKINKGKWKILRSIAFTLLVPFQAYGSIQYTQEFTNNLKIDTVFSPMGDLFLRITGQNIWGAGELSSPEIPYTVVRFLVPDNAYNFTVDLEEVGSVTSYESDLPLYPVQENISINDYTIDMFTEPKYELYQNHSSSFKAEVVEDSWLEGRYHVVAVSIFPMTYSFEKKRIDLCQKMKISLNYDEQQSLNKKKKREGLKGFINIKDIVVNTESYDGKIEKTIPSSEDEYVEPDRYYIISEGSLLPALKELAEWKTQKGYIVTLKSIEEILQDSRYKVNALKGIFDSAASLRKYLQDEEDEYGSFFCLLVGDHQTKMPIRKVRIAQTDNTYGNYYIPTDNYFSDLSQDDWNLIRDRNGLYVCSASQTSFTPDIYVGRLLCHSIEQIKNYVSKLILYESNPGRGHSEYLDNISLTVQFDGANCHGVVLEKMKETFTYVNCLKDGLISDSKAYGKPSSQEMLATINQSGYCSLQGHGEPSTIACSGIKQEGNKWEFVKALESYCYNEDPILTQTGISHSVNNNGLDLLTNNDAPSIIYTIACTTCPFDIYNNGTINFNLPHTMASSFTVEGRNGGVAYLGNTREGYWGPSSNLEVMFLDNILTTPQIGVAEAMSKFQYSGSSHVKHTHNLIGDPEFEIWLCKPKVLDINMNWLDENIILNGIDQIGCKAVINDGTGNINVFDMKKIISHNLHYINNNDRMVAVGLYKTGYLPIVTLTCDNQILKNCEKNFVVREARLGLDSTKKVDISTGANVVIRSVDSTVCGKSLTVSDGGSITINCDKSVEINGSVISSGGRMIVNGEEICFSNGFSVELGAEFSVNKKL